jgi:hypothetical protein
LERTAQLAIWLAVAALAVIAGLNARDTAKWKKRAGELQQQQARGGGDGRAGLSGAGDEELQEAAQAGGGEEPGGQARGGRRQALAQEHGADPARRSAHGEAEADFVGPAGGRCGGHGVTADEGEL